MPYILGFGFKGMLRTILETDYYLRNHSSAEKRGGRVKRAVQSNKYAPKHREKFLLTRIGL